MAKPKEKQPLDKALRKWLTDRGYPLEFLAARAFRRAGFRPIQGAHVADPNSVNAREIDVLAELRRVSDDGDLILALWCVECTNIEGHPWIALSSDAPALAPFVRVTETCGSAWAQALLWRVAKVAALRENFLFKDPAHATFAGLEAFKNSGDRDGFYNHLLEVSRKAELLTAPAPVSDPDAGEIVPQVSQIVFPVLVVRGPLFEASYSDDGIALVPRDWIRMQWYGSRLGQDPSFVDVVRDGHLDQYLSSAMPAAKELLDELLVVHHQMANKIRKGQVGALTAYLKEHNTGLHLPDLLADLMGSRLLK